MSQTARSIVVTMTANAAPLVAGMNSASAATGRFATQQAAATTAMGRSGAAMGTAATAAGRRLVPALIGGAGVVGALRSSVGAAAEFESATARLRAQIGLTTQEADQLASASRRVGRETGIGAQEAVDASFFIASAGLRGADAMDALERSAQAARVGLGETATVADLVTSAMNAYGSETLDASAATDVLMGAVREGKAEAEELASSMGQVLPVAAEMGVTFDQVGAAQAAMTRTGTNAATAATQLRSILTSLLNPSQGAAESMREFGLSAAALRETVRDEGLLAALTEIREATAGNDEAMSAIFPNVRALAGVLDLTGANAAETAEIFEALTEATGLLDEAIAETEGTQADVANRLTAAWQDFQLEFGRAVGPGMTTTLETANTYLQAFADGTEVATRTGVSRWQMLEHALTLSMGEIIDLFNGTGAASFEATNMVKQYEVDLRQLPEAHRRAGGSFGDVEGGAEAAAEALDEAAQAVQEYVDTVRRAEDPVYALQAAVGDVEDAQRNYNETVKEHGAASDEAVEASLGLMRALGDAEAAAINTDLSFSEFEGRLASWVASGQLTAEQANAIRERVAELRGEADNYSGNYHATVTADTSQAMAQLRALRSFASSTGAQIAGVTGVGGITQHSGGPAGHGPLRTGDHLEHDEFPTILQDGEYVLRRSAAKSLGLPLLNRLNRMHTGGLVSEGVSGGLADTIGGLVTGAKNTDLDNYTDTLRRVERLIDRWQQAEQDRQTRQRRAELVQAVNDAEGDRAAAESKDERRRASEALARAQQQLTDHDRAQARAAEEAAAANHKARLEQRLRRVANREQWEFDRKSTSEQLQIVNDQLDAMAGTTREWTDEYVELMRLRERLMQEEAQAAADLADEHARAAADARDAYRSALDDLNRMLDQRDRLLERWADAEARYHDRVTAATERATERQTAARRRAADEIASLTDARTAALTGSIAQGDDPWDWTAGSIARELDAEADRLVEWADALDELRAAGVDADVIDMMGLAAGPEALGQIRVLLSASHDEIARLNDAAARRAQTVEERVAAERVDGVSRLARDVAQVERDLASELRDIRRDLHTELAEAEAEWHETQKELGQQLAAIGLDTGRGYADAIAEGIEAGIPGIEAQVGRVKSLLSELQQARGQLGRELEFPDSSGDGPTFTNPRLDGLRTGTFDTGGILKPGLTLARNATGRDEYVFTGPQLAALAAPTAGAGGPTVQIDVHGNLDQVTLDQVRREVAAGVSSSTDRQRRVVRQMVGAS